MECSETNVRKLRFDQLDTTFARPIVFGTMRNILIFKYWARKAKFHDISRYLADRSVVE